MHELVRRGAVLLCAAALLGSAVPSAALISATGCCGCACVNGVICGQLTTGAAECEAVCDALLFPCSEPINSGFDPDPSGCEQLRPCAEADRAAAAPALGSIGLAAAVLALALLARRRIGGMLARPARRSRQ